MLFRRAITIEGLDIAHTKQPYRLVISNRDMAGQGKISFYTRAFQDPRIPQTEIPITGRNHTTYLKERKDLKIDPNLQYIEVGIGLGGFIPHLVRKFGSNLKHKPIAIDPIDYDAMKTLLRFALVQKNLRYYTGARRNINEFLKRIDIITNPSKVNFLNMKLSEALANHPEIRNKADAVIDLAGPKIYCETEIDPNEDVRGISLSKLRSRISFLEAQLQK